MVRLFSRRGTNIIAAIGCFSLIAFSILYFENHLFYSPCPLCYTQRIALGVIGFFFIIAAVFPAGRRGGRIHGIWLFLLACCGSALSIRHLYVQNQPKGTTSTCGQDIYGLFENTPFYEAVKTMLLGSGDCNEVLWQFLGLSIPGWTLIGFIGFGVWGLFHNAFRD